MPLPFSLSGVTQQRHPGQRSHPKDQEEAGARDDQDGSMRIEVNKRPNVTVVNDDSHVAAKRLPLRGVVAATPASLRTSTPSVYPLQKVPVFQVTPVSD